MCSCNNPLVPMPCIISGVITESPDTKTFCVTAANGRSLFIHQPGQCAMLGVPDIGEAMFSISAASDGGQTLQFSIKAVGKLTNHLHKLSIGASLTVRGPYGRPFPVADTMLGQDLVFIGGGIGLAPLRPVIQHVLQNPESYGTVDIVYGARQATDIVFKADLFSNWPNPPNTHTHITIDKPQPEWSGHVGFVPAYVRELAFTPKTAIVCGPPVMIKYTIETLLAMGFAKAQVYTTLEMRMKCGIGQCGRCNIGSKYICKDGPVFRSDELDYLPQEY